MSHLNKKRRLEDAPSEIDTADAASAGDAHKSQVLIYLSLGPRKGVPFDVRCFLKITERKFSALLESLESGNRNDETVLHAFGAEIDCPLALEDLKYSVHHDTNIGEYMKFYKLVTEILQDTFESGDQLRIVL